VVLHEEAQTPMARVPDTDLYPHSPDIAEMERANRARRNARRRELYAKRKARERAGLPRYEPYKPLDPALWVRVGTSASGDTIYYRRRDAGDPHDPID
jgi:hypothetical protein